MKLLNIFLVLVLVTPLVLSVSALPQEQEQEVQENSNDQEVQENINNQELEVLENINDKQQEGDEYHELLTEQSSDDEVSSEHKSGRVLYQRRFWRPRRVQCNKYPWICHAWGSPGPHCCNKKCVNVLADRMNCGACGNKCKYNQTCCNGKCVNPYFSRGHCGGCNNRCKVGGFCAFGLCNYA
ncbi:stigma-specific STIG1-like protein 4 [Mercurialis annua]|uniref:stigma-specific STIG1-like protein 4 n=1 Tax=Mercurialis annua TaxID=3986 RepID=UPI00215E2D17|nr:stigma-specific STIG1-like protein 4 [Mercurialis annua]